MYLVNFEALMDCRRKALAAETLDAVAGLPEFPDARTWFMGSAHLTIGLALSMQARPVETRIACAPKAGWMISLIRLKNVRQKKRCTPEKGLLRFPRTASDCLE